VRANGFLYLSGQIGTDSTGRVVAGGIRAETRQALENIRAVLGRNGSSFDRVVKCTVFMADMQEWATMNEVYVTFFDPSRRPARSAMGATGLALDARVEIECLAAE
jgi:reactive intermediate/imine deaminase